MFDNNVDFQRNDYDELLFIVITISFPFRFVTLISKRFLERFPEDQLIYILTGDVNSINHH